MHCKVKFGFQLSTCSKSDKTTKRHKLVRSALIVLYHVQLYYMFRQCGYCQVLVLIKILKKFMNLTIKHKNISEIAHLTKSISNV